MEEKVTFVKIPPVRITNTLKELIEKDSTALKAPQSTVLKHIFDSYLQTITTHGNDRFKSLLNSIISLQDLESLSATLQQIQIPSEIYSLLYPEDIPGQIRGLITYFYEREKSTLQYIKSKESSMQTPEVSLNLKLTKGQYGISKSISQFGPIRATIMISENTSNKTFLFVHENNKLIKDILFTIPKKEIIGENNQFIFVSSIVQSAAIMRGFLIYLISNEELENDIEKIH